MGSAAFLVQQFSLPQRRSTAEAAQLARAGQEQHDLDLVAVDTTYSALLRVSLWLLTPIRPGLQETAVGEWGG